MKHDTPLGSRIAEVHNGSSLFTGDAGQGESNIRRWIIENDWLEAIIALPLNMFYNTGIATYIWVLTNRKPDHRRGKVQLIDATAWFQPLRKNLGKKNCEMADARYSAGHGAFQAFEETPQSKIFPNAAFGYWKITVERPLRLRARFTPQAISRLRFASGDEALRKALWDQHGVGDLRGLRRRPARHGGVAVGDQAEAGDEDEDEEGEARAPPKPAPPRRSAGSSWTAPPGNATGRLMDAARQLAQRPRRRPV